MGTNHKASFIILLVVACICIGISLIYLIMPTIFLTSEFETATGRSLSDFAASNPEAYSFFMSDELQQALFMLSLSAIQLMIILTLYRFGNKWGWYIGIVLTTLSLGTIIGCDIPTGNLPIILMAAGILAASYVGFILGIQPLLLRKE
jgi:hypothetical protein